MKKTLLRKLAALLDVVPPEKFGMAYYGWGLREIAQKPVCATKACVMGWATTIPEVAAMGLELRAPEGSRAADLYLNGEFVRGGDAAMKLFGISATQAQRLVYEGEDDPRAKAVEIRRLVA